MTYDELLDKWIRKLGRDCTAGEIVHDLRQLEQPVRCKDCKWWKEETEYDWDGETELTQQLCTEHDGYFEPDDFCSWGERREDAVSVED